MEIDSWSVCVQLQPHPGLLFKLKMCSVPTKSLYPSSLAWNYPCGFTDADQSGPGEKTPAAVLLLDKLQKTCHALCHLYTTPLPQNPHTHPASYPGQYWGHTLCAVSNSEQIKRFETGDCAICPQEPTLAAASHELHLEQDKTTLLQF